MIRTHSILKIIIALGLPSVSINCVSTTDDFRRFSGSVEERQNAPTPHEGIQRVDGPNVLLEVFHYETIALAKGSAGYSLFIEFPVEYLVGCSTIILPSKDVKALYYYDYHHGGFYSKRIEGVLNIWEITDEYVLASIRVIVTLLPEDLRSGDRPPSTEPIQFKVSVAAKFGNDATSKYRYDPFGRNTNQ